VTESHYKFMGTLRGYPVYKNLFDMQYYIASPETQVIFAGPFSSIIKVQDYIQLVLQGGSTEPGLEPAPDPQPAPQPAPTPTPSGTPIDSGASWLVLPLLAAAWYFGYI